MLKVKKMRIMKLVLKIMIIKKKNDDDIENTEDNNEKEDNESENEEDDENEEKENDSENKEKSYNNDEEEDDNNDNENDENEEKENDSDDKEKDYDNDEGEDDNNDDENDDNDEEQDNTEENEEEEEEAEPTYEDFIDAMESFVVDNPTFVLPDDYKEYQFKTFELLSEFDPGYFLELVDFNALKSNLKQEDKPKVIAMKFKAKDFVKEKEKQEKKKKREEDGESDEEEEVEDETNTSFANFQINEEVGNIDDSELRKLNFLNIIGTDNISLIVPYFFMYLSNGGDIESIKDLAYEFIDNNLLENIYTDTLDDYKDLIDTEKKE